MDHLVNVGISWLFLQLSVIKLSYRMVCVAVIPGRHQRKRGSTLKWIKSMMTKWVGKKEKMDWRMTTWQTTVPKKTLCFILCSSASSGLCYPGAATSIVGAQDQNRSLIFMLSIVFVWYHTLLNLPMVVMVMILLFRTWLMSDSKKWSLLLCDDFFFFLSNKHSHRCPLLVYLVLIATAVLVVARFSTGARHPTL